MGPGLLLFLDFIAYAVIVVLAAIENIFFFDDFLLESA